MTNRWGVDVLLLPSVLKKQSVTMDLAGPFLR